MASTMKNAVTRGQPRALAEIASMVLGQAPHAVLLSGPGSIGKTTLALDLAAGLLCRDPDPAERPCRACRGCRLVASGNHLDLHRLAPEGPGRQVKIGALTNPDPGTARHLIGELALLPAEGGARVAIVEQADRLNEEAQNALLKLLEEPPAGVTIVLCADDDECLLPTVRSRCARVRLSAVGSREIEDWLGELGVADAPHAARLARIAAGRPGLALAYARSTVAERFRGEIARGILDMLSARRQARLAAIREMMKSAVALDAALAVARRDNTATDLGKGPSGPTGTSGRGRKGKTAPKMLATMAATEVGTADAPTYEADDVAPNDEPLAGKLAASDRRSAAATLMEIWAAVGRDVAIVKAGGARQLHELGLVDELRAITPAVSGVTLMGFLAQLATVATQLDENVNPELALDVLALAWPHIESGSAPAVSRTAATPGSPHPVGPQ
jgi:DNA polymerase III, delta subunit